jgi:tetratricopeptide (TPR) repeat protein
VRRFQFPICNFQFWRPAGWVLVLATICFAGKIHGSPAEDYFAQGKAAYQNGQFPEAAQAFQKSAEARPSTGAFLNLGLAEWQRGHAGAAILAWEKARWLDPFEPRAADNLKFARQAAQVAEPQLKWFEAASAWLPLDAWVWLAGGGLWLAAGALVLPRIFRRRKTGGQQWLAAFGVAVFAFCLTANFGVVSRTNTGFVTGKNVPLRLTPTRAAESLGTLADGEPARVLRTRGDYYFIRTAGEAGWVEQKSFGMVCR